jgi:Icc-related predicted phosphoesterase
LDLRLLAFADVHGNQDLCRWIPELAESRDAELVILAGDLFGFPDGFESVEEAQRFEAGQVLEILASLNVPVLYVMGNDDWIDLNPGDSRIQSLHCRRVDRGEFNFVGYQYTLPFMGGPNERPEEEIAEDLRRLAPLMDERTVLVTHGPASGILDLGILDVSAGSASLRETIEETNVRAHIHGHIHRCFGRSGRHFNVAAGGEMRGMLIDPTTMQHEVLVKGIEVSKRA